MKKTVRISFEGKTYDVEVEVLDSAVAYQFRRQDLRR